MSPSRSRDSRPRDTSPGPTGLTTVVFEHDDLDRPLDIAKLFTHPERPLEIDIGTGKGRFLAARASAYPETNFLGIDRQDVRIHKTNRLLVLAGADNVRLLLAEAASAVETLIPDASVATYYVFFPDPWPKRRHHRRRLFSQSSFLNALRRTMAPGARLHVATDHMEYFGEIQKRLDALEWLTSIDPFEPTDDERTDFELVFTGQGKPIGRCSFTCRLARAPRPDPDTW